MTGLIPRNFIDDLISRTNIVDIIETRIQLKKRGTNYLALCPFHNEKSPSFTVNTTKQFFHCFGCGMSGNVISFLMEYDRLDFVTAIETLAQHLGIEVPKERGNTSNNKETTAIYPILEKASQYYQYQLRKHPQSPTAINYLKTRGLTGQIIKQFHIGYAPPGWANVSKALGIDEYSRKLLTASGMLIEKNNTDYYDRFRDRIMFPIRDRRGRVIGFGGRVLTNETPKYLNSPETSVFHKSKELYGLYEVLQSNRKLEQVLIVEGYMDVVALAQHQINFAVATLGTSTSKDHIRLLLRFTASITFCFDGDKAGNDAAWRALEICLSELRDGVQFRFLFLPNSHDPDSLVREEGSSAFMKRIQTSQSLTDVLLHHLNQQVDLQSIDGKSRFLKLAIPYLKQIPPGAFQELLLQQIGRLLHIDPDRIMHLTQKQQPISEPKAPQTTTLDQISANVRLLIALLLQDPSLIKFISDEYVLDELPSMGYQILKRLIQLLKTSPNITTAHILEHWRDNEYYNNLLTLAAWQHLIPENGIKQEFIDTWQHLLQNQLQSQIDKLMAKANKQPLELEEKQHLQALIKQKKRIVSSINTSSE